MPQPATHFFAYEQALTRTLLTPSFWQDNLSYAALGSFSPDLFYVRTAGSSPIKYMEVADTIHKTGSFQCFCAMLEHLKASSHAEDERDRVKTFVYGFYSHIITDCVFHPYVYRKTQDHWFKHPLGPYAQHKDLEATIDNYLIARRLPDEPDLLRKFDVNCNKPRTELLASGVYETFLHGLTHAYADTFARNFLERLERPQPDNPIQKAYRDFYIALGFDFLNMRVTGNNIMNRSEIKPLDQWSNNELIAINLEKAPWFATNNAVLTYSVPELFDMAVSAISNMITAGEKFLASSDAQASLALGQFSLGYLKQDMNIDTGLPASLNDVAANGSDDPSIRLTYQDAALADQYRQVLQA